MKLKYTKLKKKLNTFFNQFALINTIKNIQNLI